MKRIVAGLALLLKKPPPMEGRWSPIRAYPEDTGVREFPFVMKDVPLP